MFKRVLAVATFVACGALTQTVYGMQGGDGGLGFFVIVKEVKQRDPRAGQMIDERLDHITKTTARRQFSPKKHSARIIRDCVAIISIIAAVYYTGVGLGMFFSVHPGFYLTPYALILRLRDVIGSLVSYLWANSGVILTTFWWCSLIKSVSAGCIDLWQSRRQLVGQKNNDDIFMGDC